ncbi:hypothetical protein LBMAG53_28310 [Planctomycetota bacterium]|nr:hypothetical protein LBMAG53_28310 [Planctomycetota bacterium]
MMVEQRQAGEGDRCLGNPLALASGDPGAAVLGMPLAASGGLGWAAASGWARQVRLVRQVHPAAAAVTVSDPVVQGRSDLDGRLILFREILRCAVPVLVLIPVR